MCNLKCYSYDYMGSVFVENEMSFDKNAHFKYNYEKGDTHNLTNYV